MKRHRDRVRNFIHFVGKLDQSGKRIGPRFAWKLAGIASGHVKAMPDDIIAWWWKLHDLDPRNATNPPASTAGQQKKANEPERKATGAS